MSEPSTTLDSDCRSPRHLVIPEDYRPLGPPPFRISSLLIKTAGPKAPGVPYVLRHNDQINDDTYVAGDINERPSQPTKDAVSLTDKNHNGNHETPTAAPTFSPPAPVIPLMPAMIGPTEICPAEVWSNDPNFMMYCYKIMPCTHRTPHDWRICPWAHPNERAARRCPRQYVYASNPCVYARSGRACAKGPACEYSHNVTEYWLHPTRYRAEWCSLGLRCNRRLCYFAHSELELRLQSPALPPVSSMPLVQLADLVRALEQPSQQHKRESQPSAGESDGPIENSSTHPHPDLLQLLMSATSTFSNAPLADSPLMPPPPNPGQRSQQAALAPVSIPAFYDLLGAVANAPPAPAILQPPPHMQEFVQPVAAVEDMRATTVRVTIVKLP